jgi:hypothetical protein
MSLVTHVPVQQVSVFLDNRPGSLSEVMGHLDRNQIKIFALSIADAGEYGLVRMVTDDPEKATQVLEDADFNLAISKKNSEVTAILITERDKMSKITKILGESGLNIEYAYSSAVHTDGKFALILRVNDLDKAEKTLKEKGVTALSLAEMKEHFQ